MHADSHVKTEAKSRNKHGCAFLPRKYYVNYHLLINIYIYTRILTTIYRKKHAKCVNNIVFFLLHSRSSRIGYLLHLLHRISLTFPLFQHPTSLPSTQVPYGYASIFIAPSTNFIPTFHVLCVSQ